MFGVSAKGTNDELAAANRAEETVNEYRAAVERQAFDKHDFDEALAQQLHEATGTRVIGKPEAMCTLPCALSM